jgi:UDP-N-acetylmuramoyl-L-alanyl-D-glutamate--2,6-diaminopimelate ligase
MSIDIRALARYLPSAATLDAGVVSHVTHDSRQVRDRTLYTALPGSTVHGATFVTEAVAAGAVAVLTDPVGAHLMRDHCPVSVLVHDDPRLVLGELSSVVFGEPSSKLNLVGITGTSGKTSVAHLTATTIDAGARSGLIGGIECRIGARSVRGSLTTPEAPAIQAYLAEMVASGISTAVMEVSSHAVQLHRIGGCQFDLVVFTNLSRDHLDFHPTIEDYFQTKKRLFSGHYARAALINVDDPHGRRLAETVGIPTITYSTECRSADWTALAIKPVRGGSTFTARGPGGASATATVRQPGHFNVANALAALAAAQHLGVDIHDAVERLGNHAPIPGRMQYIDAGQRWDAIVDYAHKPGALAAVLDSVGKGRPPGKVHVVFGCGGDRDPGKRAEMGEIAAAHADYVYLTNDNPRSEDPQAILAEIYAGSRRTTSSRAEIHVIANRRKAIAAAVHAATDDDVVVIAGKGHETGQTYRGVTFDFDDRTVTIELIEHRMRGPLARRR